MTNNSFFKITTLLFILCFVSYPHDSQAQKSEKSVKSKETTALSETTRKLSSQFADGIREFYSEDYATAEKSFRYIISQNPQSDASYFMLGKIRSANQDYAGASYYYSEAIKICKDNIWYKVELATSYNLMNDYKNAAKYWEEICKEQPDNEYYLCALAESYINMEEYLKVIDVYDKLEVLMGYNDDITEDKQYIWLYLNNIKGAINEYDKLIKKFPSEIKYYIKAGNIYQSNNMPDKAIVYYEKALKIDPLNPEINFALSNYYKMLGKEDKSYEMLLTVFKNSNFPVEEKLRPLQVSFLAASNNKEDEKLFKQCTQLSDAFIQAHPQAVEGWATKGALALLKKDYETAKTNYQAAIQLDSTQYTIWEDYLHVLMKLNDYQTIISNKQFISELFPTNAMMLFNLGVACQRNNQAQDAIKFLEQASTYAFDKPLFAAIYNVMGDAYKSLGNTENALKYWKLAQKNGMSTKELENKINEK